jgi:hypothetical protein
VEDGFHNDEVRIVVNGHEIFHKRGVSTKLMLGMAENISTQVSEGDVVVEISLSRGISGITQLSVNAAAYLGISIIGGSVRWIADHTPFGYA